MYFQLPYNKRLIFRDHFVSYIILILPSVADYYRTGLVYFHGVVSAMNYISGSQVPGFRSDDVLVTLTEPQDPSSQVPDIRSK